MTAGVDLVPPQESVRDASSADDSRGGFGGTVVGLRELKAAARRHRRLWLSTAAAGLVLGASFHVILPRSYKAVTNLYLVEPPGTTPSEAMSNDVGLLRTRAVAVQASAALPGHPDVNGISSSYTGVALSDSILSVSAKASSPAEAVARSNAIAGAFLAVRNRELQRESAVVVTGLRGQIAALNAGPHQYPLQVSQLESQVLADQLDLKSTVEGSFVLDAATPVRVSAKKVTAEDMLSGLVAGLGLGLGAVVVGEMVSDRPRRRAEVATALGTEVELSVGRFRARPGSRRLLRKPSRSCILVGRRIRGHLDSAAGGALAVLTVGAEEQAALVLAHLAISLAAEGRRVLLVDMADGRPLASTFRVKRGSETASTHSFDGHELTVLRGPDDPGETASMVDGTGFDVVLVLATADPAFGAEHLRRWTREVVVVVAGGKGTTSRLRGTAQMLSRAGVVVKSAILVGSDPHDDTIGVAESEPVPIVEESRSRTVAADEW